jgi:hypothetical protein
LRAARRTKKFMRSKSQPQIGLRMRRATLGMTPVRKATSTTERFTPYFGLARNSTRMGSIMRLAVPMSIQDMSVRRRMRSVLTKRRARKG